MKADKVSSLFLLFVGVFIIYFSKILGLGDLKFPGPGFLTFWAGVILCGLSIVVFIQSIIMRNEKKSKRIGQLWKGTNWVKMVMIIIALLIYCLTFMHLGYLISTAALLLFLTRVDEPLKWPKAIGVALIASIVTFTLFDLLLKVQLPHSIIEDLIYRTFVY
jgi:putative tricarboxylic transport membrane protein